MLYPCPSCWWSPAPPPVATMIMSSEVDTRCWGEGVRVCQSCKHKWVLHYSPATTRYSHLLMTRISAQSLVSRHELRINHSFFCRHLSSVFDVIGTVVRKYKYFFRQGHLIFSEGSWGVCWKAGTDLDIELYWLSSRASSWSGVSWTELGINQTNNLRHPLLQLSAFKWCRLHTRPEQSCQRDFAKFHKEKTSIGAISLLKAPTRSFTVINLC